MAMTEERTLITGASSGIGKALAHEFAKHGHPLVMVAKDEEKLEQAAEEVRAAHGIEVIAIAKDLADERAPGELYDELGSQGLDIHILVNDAGAGYRSPFHEAPLDKVIEMLRVDVEAVVRLTQLFLPDMVERGAGRILNVGSIAGFQPGPLMAVYNASKAFVNSFSESLIEELKDTGVTVTCLCPGPVDTDFFKRAGMADARSHDPKLMMQPEQVAKEAHEGTMKGEHIVLPGMMNKVMTFSRHVMTLEMQAKLQKKFYESKEG